MYCGSGFMTKIWSGEVNIPPALLGIYTHAEHMKIRILLDD